MTEARGVKRSAGANDSCGIAAGEVLNLGRNNVTRICNVYPNALEAGVGNALCECARLVGSDKKLAVATCCRGFNMPRRIHNDVAVGEFFVASVNLKYASRMRIKGHGVKQIVYLGLTKNLIKITQIKLRCKPLKQQRICNMCSHVTCTDDANFAYQCHSLPIPSYQRRQCAESFARCSASLDVARRRAEVLDAERCSALLRNSLQCSAGKFARFEMLQSTGYIWGD